VMKGIVDNLRKCSLSPKKIITFEDNVEITPRRIEAYLQKYKTSCFIDSKFLNRERGREW
jgi:hypothetical protein